MKPSDDLEHLREQLENLLGLSHAFLTGQTLWRPATDAYETESEFVVRMDVAGVSQDDLTVSAEGALLKVKGRRRDGSPRCSRVFHKMEIHVGPFERQLMLPKSFQGGRITARYEDGILEVRVARSEQHEHPGREGHPGPVR